MNNPNRFSQNCVGICFLYMKSIVKGGEHMQTKIIIVALIIIVGIAAFFGGVKYQQAQAGSSRQFYLHGGQGGNMGLRRFGGQGNANFQATRGQVVSVDTNNITLKLQDGSTKLINLSGSTRYMKEDQAASSDIKSGTTIMVIGSTNSDGSISAQDVQINPLTRMSR